MLANVVLCALMCQCKWVVVGGGAQCVLIMHTHIHTVHARTSLGGSSVVHVLHVHAGQASLLALFRCSLLLLMLFPDLLPCCMLLLAGPPGAGGPATAGGQRRCC
jgi:hypothetical protein